MYSLGLLSLWAVLAIGPNSAIGYAIIGGNKSIYPRTYVAISTDLAQIGADFNTMSSDVNSFPNAGPIPLSTQLRLVGASFDSLNSPADSFRHADSKVMPTLYRTTLSKLTTIKQIPHPSLPHKGYLSRTSSIAKLYQITKT